LLIRITNTAEPATDLGFLLHKNPANLYSAELSLGKVYVFYTSATPQQCTACLLLELDPVELVRGAARLEDYVNDRPYVSSSYLTVALSRVFGTALAGNCNNRPELVTRKLPLEIAIEVIRARGGEQILRKLFEPLGYTVAATPIPLDEKFPEWGESPYFRLIIAGTATVHDVLSHLYVLLPVLDEYGRRPIAPAARTRPLRQTLVSRA
jgi:3' terminal RNA ribose 2'-O-methyltransferase Hen1